MDIFYRALPKLLWVIRTIACHLLILYNHSKLSNVTLWVCSDGWAHTRLRKAAHDSFATALLPRGTPCRRHVPAGCCTAGWPCAAAGWPPPAAAEQRGTVASRWPRPPGSGARSGGSARPGLWAWATPSQTASAERARSYFKHFVFQEFYFTSKRHV